MLDMFLLPSLFAVIALAKLSTALPLKRASEADITVLRFAALAESLESSFYAQALTKFTATDFEAAGYANGETIVSRLQIIQADEQIHLDTLPSVIPTLGGHTDDLGTCKLDFETAFTDVQAFVAPARTLEFVGTSAYQGATMLIEDKSVLLAAASILTVEARHSSTLNLLGGGSTIPSAFDMALAPSQVLGIAGAFVSECDVAAILGIEPSNPLRITTESGNPPRSGDKLQFEADGLEDKSTLFCNMITGGSRLALQFPANECIVPAIDGPVYVSLSNSTVPLNPNIISMDMASIVAGPSLVFIDSISNPQAQFFFMSD